MTHIFHPIKSSHVLISVLAGALVLGIGGFAYFSLQHSGNVISQLIHPQPAQQQGTSGTSAPTVSQSVQTTSTPSPTPAFVTTTVASGVSQATSHDLGITFKYGNSINMGGGKILSIITNETGNKIYIYTSNQSPAKGSDYLQEFNKSASDSLSQAITDTILSGYNTSDCPITVSQETTVSGYPATYQIATVTYNKSNIYSESGDPIDTSKCPATYTSTADSNHLFFLVDTNHPDRFLFINDEENLATQSFQKDWPTTITLF